jgi:hypothetical protein
MSASSLQEMLPLICPRLTSAHRVNVVRLGYGPSADGEDHVRLTRAQPPGSAAATQCTRTSFWDDRRAYAAWKLLHWREEQVGASEEPHGIRVVEIAGQPRDTQLLREPPDRSRRARRRVQLKPIGEFVVLEQQMLDRLEEVDMRARKDIDAGT